jgi:hypothetical protein
MAKGRKQTPNYLKHPIWDTHLVPGISNLVRQVIKPVPVALKPDPLQFVISALLLGIDAVTRVRILNFIRRTREAYEEYALARNAYNAFFRDEESTQKYFDALHHFEICLASAYQGHELLFGAAGKPFFDKDVPGRAELAHEQAIQ